MFYANGDTIMVSKVSTGDTFSWEVPRPLFVVPASQFYTIYPINPRIAQLTQFVAAVSIQDVVASAHGSMRLGEYFAERAEMLLSSSL